MLESEKAHAKRALAGGLAPRIQLSLFRSRRSERDEPPRRMKAVGLFAGIAGLELGLARSGHETVLLCEIDEGARAVLEARLPDVRCHDDIRTLECLPPDTDLIAAGFPCQDLSQAGRTQGITGISSGLVGEIFRLLRRRRVPWVLLENVSFMLQLSKGRALDVIVTEFERLGYKWAYRVVDTRAFGLPQRRQRVFFVASLEGDPREVLFADEAGEREESESRKVACGFYWTEGIRGLGWAVNSVPTLKGGSTVGIPSPPAILLPDGDVVVPDIRDAERLQGFEAAWTEPAEKVTKRGHRWKLVGNAVSVDVAEWLGRRLARPGIVEIPVAFPQRRDRPWPRAAWNVGEGRHRAEVSTWPVALEAPSLQEFLRYRPAPLSARATAGFLTRTQRATLRFPPGFLEKVEAHLRRMEANGKK